MDIKQYNAPFISNRIKELAKEQGYTANAILNKAKISNKNMFNNMEVRGLTNAYI